MALKSKIPTKRNLNVLVVWEHCLLKRCQPCRGLMNIFSKRTLCTIAVFLPRRRFLLRLLLQLLRLWMWMWLLCVRVCLCVFFPSPLDTTSFRLKYKRKRVATNKSHNFTFQLKITCDWSILAQHALSLCSYYSICYLYGQSQRLFVST